METPQRNIRNGYLLISTAAVLWGTTGTAQFFAPSGTDPLALGFLRILFGGLFLLLLDLPGKGFRILKGPWPWKATLGAAMGMGFYQLFFFAALLKTGVAVGTMITIGSAPIVAGIIGLMIFRERLTRTWFIATILAVGGCCILSFPSGAFRIEFSGVLLALCAGISWAIAGSSMKMMPSSRSPVEKAAIMLLLGSVIIAPVIFFRDFSWVPTVRGTSAVLYLSLIATALPYVFFATGIPDIPVSTAYTLTLAEPLTASCLGIFLLGEDLTITALTGIVLIFAGLVILSLKVTGETSPVTS